MASEKQKQGLERARVALNRVRVILDDNPETYPMGEIVGRIKNGSLCVIRTDRLSQLLDRLDECRASLVEEQTQTGKKIEQRLFEMREDYE